MVTKYQFYQITDSFFASLCHWDSKHSNKLSWHKINWIQNGIPKSHMKYRRIYHNAQPIKIVRTIGRFAICSGTKFKSIYLLPSLDFCLWFCLSSTQWVKIKKLQKCAEFGLCRMLIAQNIDPSEFECTEYGSCRIWIKQNMECSKFGSCNIWIVQNLERAEFGSCNI